jgi:hypothetical protein
LFAEAGRRGITDRELERISGIPVRSLKYYRSGRSPGLANMRALINAVHGELIIIMEVDDEGKGTGLRQDGQGTSREDC